MSNDELTRLLREMVTLYKVINKPVIVKRLEEELSDPKLRLIYELSNGERSAREVAQQLAPAPSHGTILRYWRLWAGKGLMEPSRREGRYQRVFDLTEYGLSSANKDEE
ncbi:MAG: hypothetical protein ACM3X4_08220 [Ignavibacteriales bacterium]